ncbi:hypothetical protein [Amycolatopsis sp. NPDC001319]|uniref:hypothetical protein n=1 Tax=unclassified Amycolatopsis TaxID=2618356 RepID=UPI0036A87A94
MPLFISRPRGENYVQWTGSNLHEIQTMPNSAFSNHQVAEDGTLTMDGGVVGSYTVPVGDWVATGFVVTAADFATNYQAIPPEANWAWSQASS